MQTTYTPRPGSLPAMVVGFFQNNRDEELGLDDITDKFDCVRGNIHTQLALALDAELITRRRNDDGEYIYSPGKNLPKDAIPATDSAFGSAPPPRRAPKWPAEAAVPLPDIAEVAIEDGVPMPGLRGPGHKLDWKPLLQKLQLNQSFALPLKARHTLSANVTELHKTGKAKYTLRTLKETQQVRAWRVA